MYLSLHTLSLQIQKTIRRFPVASALAGLWTTLCIYKMELENDIGSIQTSPQLANLIFVTMLGFAVLVGVTLIGERWNWGKTQRIAAAFISVALLGVYFYLVPQFIAEPEYHFIRYALFFICACLAISVGPFAGKGLENDFWSFNRKLFQGFAVSMIFAGTLCVGVFIAMASIAYLFERTIDERFYVEVWFFMAGIVATHIFLSRIPATFTVQKNEQWYPTIVRVFAQYILLPLVGLYTFILSVYSVKILLTNVWPKGQVCYMVLGYAAIGMITDALLSPSRAEKNYRWVTVIGNVYYALLALFTFLLYGAIWQRIAQYGFTENRYFVVVLGAWTLCMSVYFLIKKTHSIKLIPITLFCLLLLTSFGPWSAFSVSKESQYRRMETILNAHNLLQNGVIVPVLETDPLTLDERKTVSNVVDYLYQTHGIQSLQPYFSFDLAAFHVSSTSYKYLYDYQFPETLLKKVGIEYASGWNRDESDSSLTEEMYQSFSFDLSTVEAASISGYSFMIPVSASSYSGNTDGFSIEKTHYYVVGNTLLAGGNVVVQTNGTTIATFPLREHFIKTLKPLYTQNASNIPSSDMLLKDGEWALLLNEITYDLRNDNIENITMSGWLFRK